MSDVVVEQMSDVPVRLQAIEIVERKGIGHPDTICDSIMESVSVALCREYIALSGRVLHHNIDKGLLVAGRSVPGLGGGRIVAPMRLVFGDRATDAFDGHRISIADIAHDTAAKWLANHLRFVNPAEHVVYQNEIQPGSLELMDIFARNQIVANDTSAAVGYAPMTETERLVFEAERYLNDRSFKVRFPEAGEDIKVMAVRRGRALHLTVALAFVDRFVPSERAYFESKAAITADLENYGQGLLQDLDSITVDINTLDVEGRGLGGMYLTVLGTSAECGDGGQVGRGNRANGVISLNRPASAEAAAGKNPVSHVGKIYSILSHHIANQIHSRLQGIEEVYVTLCSQIGQPVDKPAVIFVQIRMQQGERLADGVSRVREIVAGELADMVHFCHRLAQGDFPVC
jgi:S-adenosylmethionine synthetase